jgi:hypothetical protein
VLPQVALTKAGGSRVLSTASSLPVWDPLPNVERGVDLGLKMYGSGKYTNEICIMFDHYRRFTFVTIAYFVCRLGGTSWTRRFALQC